MNTYRQKSGYIIRHSRFIHERMFLCQRLFHECLGYDLDGISLDVKTCPGLIPELSGFIPYEDLPSFWVFQQLTFFHRYGNRKLAAVPRKEKISVYCQICIALVQGGQHFLLNHSLHLLNSVILLSDGMFLGLILILAFPVATTLSICKKQDTQ